MSLDDVLHQPIGRRFSPVATTAIIAVSVALTAGCREEGTATAELNPAASATVEPSATPVTSAEVEAVNAPPSSVTYSKTEKGHRVELLSELYHVDKIYKSMKGPQSTRQFPVVENATEDNRQLTWITGFNARMVDASGKQEMPQEFMCHSNLDMDATAHNQLFGHGKAVSGRLFTLSQGQFAVDFPAGFGIPMWSDEKLSLTTQVLNLNHENKQFNVRHNVTVDYRLDNEVAADKPMKPLFMSGVYGLALVEGDSGHFGVDAPDKEQHGPGCMIGERASNDSFVDEQGRQFTGHWVVKPGKEENVTLVTKIMNLPFDTTIHYIAVHLHPFAESLELRDRTTGETVYKAKTRQFPDKIGLKHVDYFSSEEGIPVKKDHEYELISLYNNTTGKDQDSMAVMLLYMHDKEYEKPTAPPKGAAQPAEHDHSHHEGMGM